MSTNYFNVPTYNPQSTVNPYAVTRTPLPIPGQEQVNAVDNKYGAIVDGQNYAQRSQIIGQLGTGPGSISARYSGLMQARQKNAAGALRGYGGISFGADDPSTPNVDESLSPSYESGRMGQNENDAYKHALATGASKGIVYSTGGEQLVGSALQRVSEEARGIVNQYASDINNLATQQLQESQGVFNTYVSLYGADSAAMLSAASTTAPTEPSLQRYTTKPNVDPTQYNVVKAGDGSYLTVKISDYTVPAGTYSKKTPPKRSELNKRFPNGYAIVTLPDGRYEVRTK